MKYHLIIHTELGSRVEECATVQECADKWKAFRDEWNVGARDMLANCGDVRIDDRLTHRVHYNGRVEEL
jgi:hypothetical protein